MIGVYAIGVTPDGHLVILKDGQVVSVIRPSGMC